MAIKVTESTVEKDTTFHLPKTVGFLDVIL